MSFRERCALAAMRESLRAMEKNGTADNDDGAVASKLSSVSWLFADAVDAERQKRAAMSAPAPAVFRHHKGGLYTVLHEGVLESTNGRVREACVVYRSHETGGLNVRTEREFYEDVSPGTPRFSRVPAPAETPAPYPPIGPDLDGTRLEMTPNGDGTVRITAHNDPAKPDPRDAELSKLRAVAEASARLQRLRDSSRPDGIGEASLQLDGALWNWCPGWRTKEGGR